MEKNDMEERDSPPPHLPSERATRVEIKITNKKGGKEREPLTIREVKARQHGLSEIYEHGAKSALKTVTQNSQNICVQIRG